MKKTWLLVGALVTLMPVFSSEKAPPHTSYCVRIDTPAHIKNNPAFVGYFKGYRLGFHDNVCTVIRTKDSQPQVDFMVVITPEIKRRSSVGPLYIERYSDKPCRVYFLTLNKTHKSLNWEVEEIQLKEMPLRLPNDALIILCDPSFIEPLRPQTILKSEDQVIELPPMSIKKDVTEKDLGASLIRAQLASLDSNAFHAPPIKRIKETDHGLISLTSLARQYKNE